MCECVGMCGCVGMWVCVGLARRLTHCYLLIHSCNASQKDAQWSLIEGGKKAALGQGKVVIQSAMYLSEAGAVNVDEH